MKKVLIVSYYFPPVNMIASKRYGTMCKYLEENGYIPYILTTKHDELAGTGTGHDCELPVDKSQIIQIGSVRHSTDVKRLGWNLALGILEKWNYYSRTIIASEIGWYETVRKEIKLETLRDIDIIIGTFPPMANLFIALYLSKRLKLPYIAEVRDLISDYTESPVGQKRSFAVDRIMEWYVFQKAALILTVTSGFKKILKARYPEKKIGIVYNGWDREGPLIRNLQDTKRKKILYYAGTLYLHRLESLRLLIRCLRKINEQEGEKIKLIIRSGGPSDMTAGARNIVDQEKMADYVHVLTAVNEAVVREEQDRAYINIVLSSIDSKDKALMTTVPGKVYELLKERAPVLAIVPEFSDVAKILNYTNKGIASIKEKEIIEFILNGSSQYVGNSKINFFSRQRQAKRLCGFMDQLLVKK